MNFKEFKQLMLKYHTLIIYITIYKSKIEAVLINIIEIELIGQ